MYRVHSFTGNQLLLFKAALTMNFASDSLDSSSVFSEFDWMKSSISVPFGFHKIRPIFSVYIRG